MPEVQSGLATLGASGWDVSSSQRWKNPLDYLGKQIPQAGFRGALLGASIEARAHPMYSFPKANYQRINGVVTLTFNYALADRQTLAGSYWMVTAGNDPDIEGTFPITANGVISAGTSTTITYLDPRPNKPAGTMLTSSGLIHDVSNWTVTSGWPMHANMHLGGVLDWVVIATGGTNIVTDWGADRIARVVAQGPYDFVFLGSGLAGNGVKAYGASAATVLAATETLIQNLIAKVAPKILFVATLPLGRDVTPTDATYTAALLYNRGLYELQAKYPLVKVVPCGETMVVNWRQYNDTTIGDDYSNGFPEANALANDGTHLAWGASAEYGAAVAEFMRPFLASIVSPEKGFAPDDIINNPTADVGGKKNRNYLKGLWGDVNTTKATLTGTGISGVGPANSAVNWSNFGASSTVVGTLETDFQGGANWRLVITSTGSAAGFTLNANYAPAELLTALNDTNVKGKFVSLLWPLTFMPFENKFLYLDATLWATVGGVEYPIGGVLSNTGQNSMGSMSRAIDGGVCGNLPSPRFIVPNATYTAASLRVTIKAVPTDGAHVAELVTGTGFRFMIPG